MVLIQVPEPEPGMHSNVYLTAKRIHEILATHAMAQVVVPTARGPVQ
jgi:hypothetical protein